MTLPRHRTKRVIASTGMLATAAALAGGAGATAVVALAAPPALAAGAASQGTSGNWAGYVAANNNFSAVSGSWTQPAAKCASGSGYWAFWVGVGGTSNASPALEQVGTQADCTADGAATFYAWYELVPAAPVKLGVTSRPGDRISGHVSVRGSQVTVVLEDRTTSQSVTKTLTTDTIDTSSAEWIAEAPSECDGGGACQPLSLADFGTVTFNDAAATASGHTGTISDPGWQSQAADLDGSGGFSRFGPVGVSDAQSGSGAGAQASSLSSDGSSFSVSWQSNDSGGTSSSSGANGQTGTGAGDSGYGSDPGSGGDGSGYGNGGYGSSDGDGYGGSGYGYGGSGYGYGGSGYGYGGVYSLGVN